MRKEHGLTSRSSTSCGHRRAGRPARPGAGGSASMAEHLLERSQLIPTPLEQTFEFFADPRNLEAITPPWLRFRIVEAPQRLRQGSLLRYRLRLFGVPVRWTTEITDWDPPHGFADT